MTEPNNVCVLVAEIPGADRIAEALEPAEARRALERCMHRIDLAIEAHGGTVERRADARACASFRRGDAAVLAICEMFDRVQSLPPLRGLRMTICVGLHCGTGADDAELGATRLAEVAKPGHALASEAVVTQLSATGRQFVAASASRNPALAGLGWTAFAVARQPAAASTPADKPVEPRVRVRHGQDTLFVDHARPVVLLGRELGNDIVISDPRASRQHARIERRRDGFVLIDQSTNGTFLADDSGKESCIKGAELVLAGSGRIGCGFSANEVERELVFVDIV
ncbi:FHA domain-containing protein [Aromatoleum petrolei]|uniref:FHA domain-containing protein n=1 Tax=Aromatoleum petrolei TaxID=76116 RepID=A0ABX1MQA5_9RHOO|nr:FHA domain-containing protein [Aromatoleum petrolei]NMF89973.1 FHA domain-containing protein [Aromatoleum petrolei]QTQ36394.1 Forkhead-associated (FHA) domain-containing protein [Aromatoleum petrolei]